MRPCQLSSASFQVAMISQTSRPENAMAGRRPSRRWTNTMPGEDGTITQENADWLLEGLDKGFIGGPGGFGHGFGGPRGDGLGPKGQPPVQDGE
jgi:hypothetical protein